MNSLTIKQKKEQIKLFISTIHNATWLLTVSNGNCKRDGTLERMKKVCERGLVRVMNINDESDLKRFSNWMNRNFPYHKTKEKGV